MIVTTTQSVSGQPIVQYLGIVTAEVIIGANVFRDIFALARDFFGGRSGAYQNAMREARHEALDELEAAAREQNADAIVGVQISYQTFGRRGSMLMVAVSGTAVRL